MPRQFGLWSANLAADCIVSCLHLCLFYLSGTAACIVVLISCGGVVLIVVLVITELLHRTFKVRCIAVSDHMDEPVWILSLWIGLSPLCEAYRRMHWRTLSRTDLSSKMNWGHMAFTGDMW